MPPFRENSDIISSQDSDTHSLRKRDNSLQRKPKYSPHLDQNSQQITETSLYPGLAIHSEIVNQSKIVFAEQMKGKERTIPQGEPSGNVKDPPNKILARPLMGSNQSKLNYSPEKQDIRHHEALESAGQAMAFCRLEKYNEALTAANRAVTLHNDRASHHCLKARILYMLEEFDKALESTNQAITLDKNDALSYCVEACIYHKLKKYDKALESVEQSIEINKNDASSHRIKAEIYYSLEKYDEALESANQAIILDKNDASSHCIKSQILLVYGKHEKYDEALESANQAIILDKDNASSHYVKSKILCKYGKYDKALESINRSREIDPYNTLYLFHKINVECLIKENSPESISSHILPNTNLSPEIQHSTELIYKTPDLKITSSTRETTQIREAVQNSARDLATIIENHESYQGFPTKEEAILMLCGYDGKKKLDELNRDDWLYLEGTLNGMKYVLERYKNQPNEKLTGKYLVEIQKHFLPKEYIKGSIGNITEMTGFRNQDTSFAIGPDGWIGYQEWKKQCDKWNKDSNHKLYQMFMTEDEVKAGNVMNTVDYNNQAVAVVVNHKREEPQLNEAGDCFFEECDNDIQEASNTNEEVHIRGRTLGWLGKGQLLNDANSRAAAYGIAFKWVLENRLEPMMMAKEQTTIFKGQSTGVIYGAMRYKQLLFEHYKENGNELLELIEKGEFNKELFEAKFNEERKKREDDFKNRVNLQKNSIINAYGSFKVYKKIYEVKKKINKITKEQLEGNMKDNYLFAKNIGEHIENFFIDRNYSNEASMESLFQINANVSSLYNTLQSVQSTDSLFRDLCVLSQRIQQANKKDTAKNTQNSKYLTIPDNIEISSNKSSKSSNSSPASVASKDTLAISNASRRPSSTSDHESTSSQMLDITALLPSSNIDADEFDPN